MDSYDRQEVQDDEEPLVLGKEHHEAPNLVQRRVFLKKRNFFGTVLNLFLLIPFLLVMAGSIISLSLFAYENDWIHAHSIYNNDTYGYCVLFASYDLSSTPAFQFGENATCALVIYSLVAIAVLAALFFCGACVRGILGLAATNPLVVVDLFVLVLCSAAALSDGIVISFGRFITCQAISYTVEPNTDNCTSPVVVDNDGVQLDSDYILRVSEMSAWATFLLLALLTLLHLLLTLTCCYTHFRRRGPRGLSIQADNEPSPFSPPHLTYDDDERMLDPSSNNATKPVLAFTEPTAPVHPAYTSFHPTAGDPWSTN